MTSVLARPSELAAPQLRRFVIGSQWLEFGASRLDATAYDNAALRYLDAMARIKDTVRLGDALTHLYNLPRFKRVYAPDEKGWPYVSAKEISWFRLTPERFIDKDSAPNGGLAFFAREGWILITCSGTIGRLRLVTERDEQYFFTHDLIRAVPKHSVPYGYLYAFLASPYGQAVLTRPAYGATVNHLYIASYVVAHQRLSMLPCAHETTDYCRT